LSVVSEGQQASLPRPTGNWQLTTDNWQLTTDNWQLTTDNMVELAAHRVNWDPEIFIGDD
jgi:hypothetical protein